ncbi:redoxin domain-containing protein [Acidaminobacter sp. JC074]|nr:redoxin domain-containing protein [Acidaminobacter sp. JC074]
MKKILILLGITVLSFSLIACGTNTSETDVEQETQEAAVETEETADVTKDTVIVEGSETSTVLPEEELAVGKVIPNYELTTLEGDTISLHDYQGKILILNFWATW